MPDLKPNEFIGTFEEVEEHEQYVAAEFQKLANAAQAFRSILWELEDNDQLPESVKASFKSASKNHDAVIDKVLNEEPVEDEDEDEDED